MLRGRGLPDEHRAYIRDLAESSPPGSRRRALFLQILAEMTSFVGDVDAAMNAFESSVGTGLRDLTWVDLCPVLAEVRKHERFARARERVMTRAAEAITAWRAPFDATSGPPA
jgi:hypothetical protein